MSLSHPSRRAAAVLGSLALVLLGGPAYAAALDTPVPALTEPLQPVVDAAAPVADPVVEVLTPTPAPVPVPSKAPEPSPASLDPSPETPAPAAPSPPAPADLVEAVVDLVEPEEPPVAPPGAPPVHPNPVSGQGNAPAPVDGPAQPDAQAPESAAPAPATTATAWDPTAQRGTGARAGVSALADVGSGATRLGSLGAFARDMAGLDESPALAPPGSAVDGSVPSLALPDMLPGMQPQLTMGEVMAAEGSGSRAPAGLPALLVAVAATAVAVSAVGQATEVRRRRKVLGA